MPDDSQIEEQNGDFEGDLEPKPPLNRIDKNQKIAAASLAVFAVLIVVLWSVQLKNSIYGPFNSSLAGVNESAQVSNQTADDLALKNKDTDTDGLSDYDELYVYKTSPYLADSDSDGVKDGEEVKNGTDPNCPLGRTCVTSELDENAAASDTPASSADILNNLSDQSEALNGLLNQSNAANPAVDSANPAAAGNGAENLTDEQKQALKGIDAASLRQLLLQNGMDKATLDQISDTDLMQSYSETLSSQ